MKFSLSLAIAAVAVPIMAQEWHNIEFQTPGNVTSFAGTIQTPSNFPAGYPGSGGTYYMWPGLQSTSSGGVYQNVLGLNTDGSTWSIGSGFCCDSGIPWGSMLGNFDDGRWIFFNNFRNSDGSWTSQLSYYSEAIATNDTFPLQDHAFNYVIFSIELYSPASWNFGPLVFSDVTVKVEGDDTSFCNNNLGTYGSVSTSVTGATATVENGEVSCYWETIALESAN